MHRRFCALSLLVLLPGISQADTPPASTDVKPEAATSAVAQPDSLAQMPQDRLPTAPLPTFFQRHPPTLPKISAPKVDWGQFKPNAGYAGLGLFSDMLHVHGDLQTSAGHFYMRAGRFMNTDAYSSFNVGWRYPIDGPMDKDGFFAGVFGGQVMPDKFLGKGKNRNGIGADMSYQWVNDHTMKVVAVGIGFGAPKKSPEQKEQSAPTVFFSYSVDLKVF